MPRAATIFFTFPEAYPGYSEIVLSREDWRGRLANALKDAGVKGFEITCLEKQTQGNVGGKNVAIWQMQVRYQSGDLNALSLARFMEQALDNPNLTEMVPPEVGLTAVYAFHQTESTPPPALLKAALAAGLAYLVLSALASVASIAASARRLVGVR